MIALQMPPKPADDQPWIVPISVDQYHMMIEAGILMSGDPFELIDGLLVRKDRSAKGANPMTVGTRHARVIMRLARLDAALRPLGSHMQNQLPVTIPPASEPEPDGVVVSGSDENFGDRHPQPRDVTSIIEVADSSLRFDRGTKLRMYARAGIGQYLNVNLIDDVVEEYTQPSGDGQYGEQQTWSRGQTFEIWAANERRLALAVIDLIGA